jgi:hypothetical protein
MYTFWKRTSPPPSMSTFDAPDRETCQVRRARTNTPLQALTTLNDPQYVEAARAFAKRIMAYSQTDLDARLSYAFRLTVSRTPIAGELSVLRETYQKQDAHYAKDPKAAAALAPGDAATAVKRAAWTAVANILLNLDEMVTRE